MSANASLLLYAGATELVKKLHDYPRVDEDLNSVSNVFPDFGPSRESRDEWHRYLESLTTPARFAAGIVTAYLLLELIVRLVVWFCRPAPSGGASVSHVPAVGMARADPDAPNMYGYYPPAPPSAGQQQQQAAYESPRSTASGGADAAARPASGGCCAGIRSRYALPESRCWRGWAVVLLAAAVTLFVVAMVSNARAAGAAEDAEVGIQGLDDTRELALDLAKSARASAASGSSSATELAALPELSPEARNDAAQLADLLRRAAGSLDDASDALREADTRSVLRGSRDGRRAVRGVNSGIVAGCSFVVALYVLVVAGLPAPRRGSGRQSCCEAFWRVVLELSAATALVVLVLAASLQLGVTMGVSDACMDPVAAATRVIEARTEIEGGTTVAGGAGLYYLTCSGENPLADVASDAVNFTGAAAPLLASLESFAASQNSSQVNATLAGAAAGVDGTSSGATEALALVGDCVSVHNHAFVTINDLCDPVVGRLHSLVVAELLLAVALIALRLMVVYRCCCCCCCGRSGNSAHAGASARAGGEPAATSGGALLYA